MEGINNSMVRVGIHLPANLRALISSYLKLIGGE
jgi:hypothetical protein